MALSLRLDHDLRVLLEPGFHQKFSARQIADVGQIGDPTVTNGLWRDPATGTLMLYPKNIAPDWINTPGQADSIIRASALVFHVDDTTNKTVFEEKAFGNAENYYIYHSPVFFPGSPSAPPPEARGRRRRAEAPRPFPGAPLPVTGAPIGAGPTTGLTTIASPNEVPVVTYSGPGVPAGDSSSGRFIAYTNAREPVNAAFFFRWHQPDPKIGHQARYVFFVGELAIEIIGNLVQLWKDISSGGDRSSFVRIFSKPMFGNEEAGRGIPTESFGANVPGEGGAHDRNLLFIPYFRNRVLLGAGTGAVYSVRVKTDPEVAPAGSPYAYKITREDTVAVWCLTPAPGRFQLQRVCYADGPVTVQLPHVTLNYTPAVLPTVTLHKDSDRGTALTGVVADPPGYSLRTNTLTVCPPATTVAGDQSRSFGVTLTFTGEATHRWTPFFYGMQFDSPTTFQNAITTPAVVGDVSSAVSYIDRVGVLSIGDQPGDGRMEVDCWDRSPYGLANYYYRSGVAVQLKSDATACFTGITEPNELEPIKAGSVHRQVRFSAVDRWKQLADHRLVDQIDWTGYGHITVVLSVAGQAGIDTSTAETLSLASNQNTPLGGVQVKTAQEAGLLNPSWQPRSQDTAARYILRIATLFSGWDVGFRADGTFFYLPKDHFTVSSVTFSQAGAAPEMRDPVEFRTIEPEANVVQAISGALPDGRILRSSLWVDWASIRNPLAVNFLGRQKHLPPIEMGGVLTCEELNLIARTVFNQARRRRRMVGFSGDYVPTLKIGQVITVGSYGTHRLKKMKTSFEGTRAVETDYEAELIELGHGP